MSNANVLLLIGPKHLHGTMTPANSAPELLRIAKMHTAIGLPLVTGRSVFVTRRG